MKMGFNMAPGDVRDPNIPTDQMPPQHARYRRAPWRFLDRFTDPDAYAVKVRVKAKHGSVVLTDDGIEIPQTEFADVNLSATVSIALEAGDLEIEGEAYLNVPDEVAAATGAKPAPTVRRQRPPPPPAPAPARPAE